jgi:PAS domain S-box-containing protein
LEYEQMTKAELVDELRALDYVVATLAFDRNGVVRAANDEAVRLLGLERRTLVGRPFSRVVDPDDAEKFRDHVDRVVATGERQRVDLRLRARDRTLEVRLESCRVASNGDAVRIRSIAIDDTDRRNLRGQLLHAQRLEAVGRLAGGIAHDFNNLLMTILGHTELLLLRLKPGDATRASVETIQETAERATALTRQLVTFSRKGIVAPRVLDPNVVVRDMDKILRRLIGEDVELEYALEAGAGSVKIDPTHLEQIVMNLAVNARDAMPEGGRLEIATAGVASPEGRGWVEISVGDTGAGMDEATRARIFEPFFTTKVAGKGTGLGLSTVSAIVDQNDGEIEVESAPGEGTRVRVRLPRAGDVELEPHPLAGVDAPGGSETVLVVEDEDPVREIVCEMLKMKGYRVIEARHGGEALLVCEQRPDEIDLMITDVVMPQMSGRQLAERLAPLQPGMKVLFMSGHTEDAVIRHGVKNALMTMLQKPFTPLALAQKVRAVLDG